MSLLKALNPGCVLIGIGLIALIVFATSLQADPSSLATLRQNALESQPEPPRLSQVENKDLKRVRNYPMQPPTIPHKIDNYLVDLNVNKCLSCHSRNLVSETQAPMVSVTHYMDRDGNFLAEVSPRRYFCSQCHVPQFDAKPLVSNDFRDMGTLLSTTR